VGAAARRASAGLGGQVGGVVGRVGERDGFRCAAVAFLVEGLGEQRIKGGRDEDVEVPDARELAERLGHSRRELLHEVAQARVDLLAASTTLEVAAHDLVERVVTGAVLGRHAQALGETLGEDAGQRNLTAHTVGHGQQFGANDRNDPTLVDVFEEVVPEKVLRRCGRIKHAEKICGERATRAQAARSQRRRNVEKHATGAQRQGSALIARAVFARRVAHDAAEFFREMTLIGEAIPAGDFSERLF